MSTHVAYRIKRIADAFPDDRISFQKGVPTFHPESAEEAAAFLKLAADTGQPVYITGFGNNIDPVGPDFEELLVLRTDRLGALSALNLDELWVEVQGGFPLREINVKLADSGAFFPPSNLPYVGSVGGALAVGLAAGLDPASWASKPTPDGDRPAEITLERYLLVLEVALPTGEVKRLGSPAQKSGAENFARIFTPSWGQFGLIVAAKFRLLPESARPEYQNLKQRAVSGEEFFAEIAHPDSYLSKVKRKFDPTGVLQLMKP